MKKFLWRLQFWLWEPIGNKQFYDMLFNFPTYKEIKEDWEKSEEKNMHV